MTEVIDPPATESGTSTTGGPLTRVSGICPAVFTLWKDETCRELDLDAYRQNLQKLVDAGVDALVTGGHAGEVVSLTPEERATLNGIAKEVAGGRIPVIGGVAADSTAEAIRQGLAEKESGADAVLFTPPAIPGWSTQNGADFVVRHYGAFEDAVGLPIVMFAAPSAHYGAHYFLDTKTITALASSVESIVGAKITAGADVDAFLRCARALKEVRDIGCLLAGGAGQFVTYSFVADGSLSGGTNFALSDDVKVLALMREGRLAEAKAISDTWDPVWDVVYGVQANLPVVYFHYRYKIAAWLLGEIERPHMRLPQLPPPVSDQRVMREALLRAGKHVVRDVEELAVASV